MNYIYIIIIVEQKIMLSNLNPMGIIMVTSYFCQSLNQTLCMHACTVQKYLLISYGE